MRTTRIAVGSILVALLAIAALAHAEDVDESQRKLLDQFFGAGKIDVVSGREETPAAAPAVVRTYTRDDIRELGLRTLGDVIRITPGFTMVTDIDDLVIGTRGIVTDNNSKFVVLLNGHNMTSTFNNGVNPNHVFPMSLENVKRVEVLTGPGSVLWGSGALLGVFNIVTEDAQSFVADGNQETEIGLGAGNQDTFRAFAQHAVFGEVGGELASVYASGKFYQSNGTDDGKTLFLGPDAVDANSRLYDTGAAYEVYANGTWGPFQATVRALDLPDNRVLPRSDASERNLSNFAELAWEAHPVGTVRSRGTVFGDWWRQKKDVRHGDASTPLELLTGGFDAPVRQFDEYRGGGTALVDWFPSADYRFAAGAELRHTSYEDSSSLTATPNGKRIVPFHAFDAAVFAQGDWWVTDWLALQGGLRYSGSDTFDDSVDPKAAIRILPFGRESFQLKYVFQKAFLHPTAFQRNAIVTIPPGSPLTTEDLPALQQAQTDIGNERLISHDLQLLWQPTPEIGFAATGFHRDLENLINFNALFDVPPPRTFVNFGDVTSWGAEVEARVSWGKLKEQVNVSWAHAEFDAGPYGLLGAAAVDGELLAFPAIMANVITRYYVADGISIAAVVRILGSADYFANGVDQRERHTTTSDVNADLDLNLRWEDAGVRGLTLALGAINVLDDSTRRPLAANPGTAYPERLTVQATSSYRF